VRGDVHPEPPLFTVFLRYDTPDGPADRVLVARLEGDRARSLALLSSAIRMGWLPKGRVVALDLAEEPAFHDLVGDPRFEAARKHVLDHIAKERAELGPLKV